MVVLRWFAPLVVLLMAWPAGAEERCPTRRHVDCAGAERAIAAAIAADPWMTLIDQAWRMRMAELSHLLGPAGAAELAAQDVAQRRVLSRDLFFTPDGAVEPDSVPGLRWRMELWLMRLIRLQPDPPAVMEGIWFNLTGEAVIRRRNGGRYLVTISTVEPYALASTCEYEGEGRSDRADRLETDDGALELTWDGPMLRIRQLVNGHQPFCGAVATVTGRYFRIGDAD